MKRMRFIGGAALAVLAAACTQSGNTGAANDLSGNTAQAAPGDNSANQSAQAEPGMQLRLGSNGLLAGQVGLHSSQQLDFGSPRDQIVAAVTAIRGRPDGDGAYEECGAGPTQYVRFGPLTLNFQEDRFVGWILDGPSGEPPIEHEMGLGIGTSRADLVESDQGEASIEQTSLGTEFDANGIHGILSSDAADARVTELWAGVSCAVR
jgi:hypothetical protein